LENEARFYEALATLPDGCVRELEADVKSKNTPSCAWPTKSLWTSWQRPQASTTLKPLKVLSFKKSMAWRSPSPARAALAHEVSRRPRKRSRRYRIPAAVFHGQRHSASDALTGSEGSMAVTSAQALNIFDSGFLGRINSVISSKNSRASEHLSG